MKKYSIMFFMILGFLFFLSKFWNETPQGQLQKEQKMSPDVTASESVDAPTQTAEDELNASELNQNTPSPAQDKIANNRRTETDGTHSEGSATDHANLNAGFGREPRLRLNAQGEPIEIITDKIHFKWNAAEISEQSFDTLQALAELIKNIDVINDLKIEGHTDASGDPLYNKHLSELRAKSVAEFLRSEGLTDTRIAYFGMGSEKPVDTNETPTGRAKNRRVEFKVNTQSPRN